MTEQQLLSMAEMFGLPLLETALAPMVLVVIVENPTWTQDKVVKQVDGNLKHSSRGKIGFAVDFIWPVIEPSLTNLLNQEYNNVSGHPALSMTPTSSVAPVVQAATNVINAVASVSATPFTDALAKQ